jgi:hypothetical protein
MMIFPITSLSEMAVYVSCSHVVDDFGSLQLIPQAQWLRAMYFSVQGEE